MLGFEVRFNDKVIHSAIDSGLMEVMFTVGGVWNIKQLFIWGLTSFHSMKWHLADVECDKIVVRIVNIVRNSELIEKEERFKTDEEMLQRYYELKQELESEGLL